jgi:hypothetical protein
MKLNEAMRYPHPVLSEYARDYVSGEFRCGFEQNVTSGGELRIASHLQLINPTLSDLIAHQKAATGYFVVCRRTYFNTLQEAPLGDSERFFDLQQLFGTVILRPIVWTLQDIPNFSSPLFDPEFGVSVNVGRGSVIAVGPEFRFSVDKKKYKPFDSIFQLDKSADVPPGTVAVDPEQDRIAILAEGKTYASVASMRGMPSGRSILLNAVYMPAVMEVIARLQGGHSGLESRKWYRVFKAKCDDLGINPADTSQSPLMLAQKLLREPLRRTIGVVESLG